MKKMSEKIKEEEKIRIDLEGSRWGRRQLRTLIPSKAAGY